MTGTRRAICGIVLSSCVFAATAPGASAGTFYVNKRNGESSPKCGRFQGGGPSGENPCLTIAEAVKVAEGVSGPNTIELSAEENPYMEPIKLENAKDAGLTINGEEPGVEITSKAGSTVAVSAAAGPITLSGLGITDLPGGTGAAILDNGARLTLDDIELENQSGSGVNGAEVKKSGSLAINGGSVVMENGASGFGVFAESSTLTLSGVNVTAGGGGGPAEAGDLGSIKSNVSVANSKLAVEGTVNEAAIPFKAEEDGLVQLQGVAIRQEGVSFGALFESSPATVDGLTVSMGNAGDKDVAVGVASTGTSTFEHLETGGKWEGAGFVGEDGNVTLADSRILTNTSHDSPAVIYLDAAEGPGLLIQRSVLEGAPKAAPSVLDAIAGNVTLDSTEVFGGVSGVSFKNPQETTRTLTLAASTVGAAPGISFEKGGDVGVDAEATGAHAVANVAIEGSILFQAQIAKAGTTNHVSVACTYSAVPSQIQTANVSSESGEISCPAGTSGNTNYSAEETTLFAEPLHNFGLSPSSSAVDSVPAGAIALPFGIVPSSTDLAGNPRIVDGNGDCLAVQDKGALELQGHAASCPTPTGPGGPGEPPVKFLTGTTTGLSISPTAFRAARSGATISRASRKRYGAKISWRESQPATTTIFTVLKRVAGRRQGRSCRKPSRSNRHGRRCTLQVKIGGFSHLAASGANSLRFSGRLKGHRLPAGSYLLRAVAHDSVGYGNTATKAFEIL